MTFFKGARPLERGDWVTYSSPGSLPMTGRVKGFNSEWVWVVFYCQRDWDRYQSFTGQPCQWSQLETKLPRDQPSALKDLERHRQQLEENS
jgi:hypothetical protein